MNSLISRAKSFLKLFLWGIVQIPFVYQIWQTWRRSYSEKISAVVFSKDRAMQLHALLSSWQATKRGECGMIVIYASSSLAHKQAYNEVKFSFKNRVRFVEQEAFPSLKHCLVQTIQNLPSGKMFFLVDDIVFTEEVDYQKLAEMDLSNTIFSLRMGAHLNYSYVVSAKQPLPKTLSDRGDCFVWDWNDGELDWGYQLSVDGHIFNTSEVLLWAKHLKYISPSTFECALQKVRFVYRNKQGMCFKKSRIVNIPANKVQTEVANLHGSVHQDDLLQQWNEGMAIDHTQFRGWNNNSVHQEAEFKLIKRES
jgi:hypothetical protein